MKVLSENEAATLLGADGIGTFVGGVDWRYPNPVPSYFLPKDSGAKVGLARVIAGVFLEAGPAILWINESGVWPTSEHVDLFKRYRLSYGESRSLAEAPVHIFEGPEDTDAFISILCICLFFVWGAEVVDIRRSQALTISHDEWLEYRYALGHEAFVSNFRKWLEPSLQQSSTSSA